MPNARKRSHSSGGTTTTEWIVAAVAAVLVFVAIGHLLYQATSAAGAPPLLTVQVDSVASRGDGHLVLFTIRNDGDVSAADVEVEGTLMRGSTMVQRSGAAIDYVPPGSERSGGLFFDHDPRRYQLELRATGYEEP